MSRAKYKVVLGDKAKKDLRAIARWYFDQDPAEDRRFIRDLQAVRSVLSTFPSIGRTHHAWPLDLRSYPMHPYIVFYYVVEPNTTVVIKRVLHGIRQIGVAHGESD